MPQLLREFIELRKGFFPTIRELVKRMRIKNYSKKGVRIAKEAMDKYTGKIGNAELIVTPCYKARSSTSTVGAGDTATAAYTYAIAGGETRNEIVRHAN